ncbi:P-loop containing nucleoside triphosphate hydrolase protein [Xylaria intraflava]|nr:P-loop containing nucleoside triphosphate hydrolase protein [Xylaria intraflava]
MSDILVYRTFPSRVVYRRRRSRRIIADIVKCDPTIVASTAALQASLYTRASGHLSAPSNFADHPFMDIGLKMQKYNDALGEFQLLGISQVAVLPELVLVGDQSSGKSTLMSALARLNIPTSSGICTRCPLHIRMSSSSHWSCSISLQQPYRYEVPKGPIVQSDVTDDNPFPPWVAQPMKKIVFKTIYEHDSMSIENILRWAQIATLNPSQNPKQFVPGEGIYAKETDLEAANLATEAKFSPNIISLEMKGPLNISFVDLPGIFAVSDSKGDDYLVDVVENLTRKYVRQKEAIIMLALPMDHDIENSRALRIIRELDAESRTIGVLTKADKPDFTSADIIKYWLAVLNGKKQKLKANGFYITALPRGETINTLTEWEKSYFRPGGKDWPQHFDDYVHHCGVDQLRFHITKELEDAIARSLPNIKEKLQNRLDETQDRLNEMPDLPRNVEHEVRTSLSGLYTSVKFAFNNPGFEKEYKRLTEWFYHHLVQLKPKCIVSTSDSGAKVRQEDVVVIESDDSDGQMKDHKRPASNFSPIGLSPKRQRRNEVFTTPAKTKGLSIGSAAAYFSPAEESSSAQRPVGRIKLSLQELQWEIKHKTRGGFSDIVPLELHESLCLNAVSQWQGPLEKFINEVSSMLGAMVAEVLENSLRGFSKRRIYRDSKELFVALLQDRSNHQYERLRDLYKNEMYRAVTINEDALNHFKAKEKQDIQRLRLFTRAKEAGLVDEDKPCKRYDLMSREEKMEDAKLLARWQAQLPEDPFQREIDVVAKVRAYYLTAATRFVDNVSIDVDAWLFRSFREGALDNYMDQKLGLSQNPSAEIYVNLMEEDTTTAQRRRQLKKEKAKLMTAMNRTLDLESSFTHSTPSSASRHSSPRDRLQ